MYVVVATNEESMLPMDDHAVVVIARGYHLGKVNMRVYVGIFEGSQEVARRPVA